MLGDPRAELDSFINGLTPAHYHVLQCSSADVPTRDLAWTIEDCRQFTARLAGWSIDRSYEGSTDMMILPGLSDRIMRRGR